MNQAMLRTGIERARSYSGSGSRSGAWIESYSWTGTKPW